MAKRKRIRPGSSSTSVHVRARGWVWAIACLAALACAAALGRAAGIPASAAGAMVMAGTAIITAVSMLRVPLSAETDPTLTRWVAIAAVAAMTSVPAITSMLPGAGVISGQLSKVGDKILLGGLTGSVRILVSGSLPGGSTAYAGYVLAAGGERIEGSFERSIRRSWHKMGRFYDARTSEYHALRLAPGAQALELVRVDGRFEGAIRVRVFRAYARGWVLVLLSVASLALAAALDAIGKHQGTFAVHAGIGIIVGALARWTATPESALASAISSVALGTPLGTVAGSAAAGIARRMRTRFVR
jgi:hypothetical protein